MAAVVTSSLSEITKQELLCTYAALILHDDNIDINEDNMQKIITASGNTVEPYMPMLFARALSGADVGKLLSCAGSGGAAPVAAAAGGGGGGAPVAAAAKEEEKKEEEEEEDDMGFSLFD